jgi:hypothetical protein
LSRFRILMLFAALAALATTFVACGGGGSSSDENPQAVLEHATLSGIDSGNLELSLHVESSGKKGGNVDVSVSGPFESGGKENLPQLGLTAKATGKANGRNIDFEGGLTLLPERAFVNYKGTEYEVDPTTFGFVKSTIEQAQQRGQGSGSADVTACQEAAEGLKFADFASNLQNEGSSDVYGTTTTKVSGELNVPKAVDALIKLTENKACAAQLEAAGPLPLDELEEAKGELGQAVKKAHLEIFVGDDHIIRKVAGELTIEPKQADEKVEVEFELALSGVNEEQEFSAPSGAKPLEKLFLKLGINPVELLEGNGTEGFSKLFEKLLGGSLPLGPGGLSGSGESSSGSSEGSSGAEGSGNAGASQQAYLECLKGAKTSTDLQKCAELVQ